MKDHSQTGEQALILGMMAGRTGRFLDIGANDGETFSNTRALALLGWGGTLVEPNPAAFERLQSLYRGSPGITLVEAAIADRDGRRMMQMASDSLVSSLDARAKDTWAHHGFTWVEQEVDCITVATLLGIAPGPYEVISIDAEGHDMSIVGQIDLEAIGCEALVIEHGRDLKAITRHCALHGMRPVHHGGINTIFGR